MANSLDDVDYFYETKTQVKTHEKTDNKTIRQSPNLRQCKHEFHISLWNLCGIFPGYIYEGDGSGYWDISLDFLTPVERNENALSGNLFWDKLAKRTFSGITCSWNLLEIDWQNKKWVSLCCDIICS